MQNAGQYGHGAPAAHSSSQFVPSQTSPTGGSTTSSLRQFRKKDVLEKTVSDSNHSIPESHVARVAPHNHYPPKTNENFRYSYHHQFPEYISGPPTQVKYSEIADIPHHQNANNVPTSVIQKPKSKEYMEMCNLQQSQVKQGYQEHLRNQQNYPNDNTPYYPKETPQQAYPGYKPENQYYSKEQYHQVSQPIPKYSPVPPPHMSKYPPQENPFLSKLRRIHPNMAMEIINDHSGIDQRELYAAQNQNRYYQGSMQPNPYNTNGYPMSHYPNYPASCNYASRPPQMSSGPRFPMSSHMERSMSPRRTYTENIPMPMNYPSMSQKTSISPNYPQYSTPEYSQHYQHRRAPLMPQEYLQQHYRPQYIPGHQIPVQDISEISETHGAPSDAIKKFFESFDAEEDGAETNAMENVPPCKETPKITEDTTSTGTVYMINASELQYFENNGIPLIASENGLPLATEYIIKSGVSLDNGMVRLVENHKTAGPEVSSSGDRIVNIHITEVPKPPDCMMSRPPDTSAIQPKNTGESDSKKIIVHQNTVVYQGNSNVPIENELIQEVSTQKNQITVFKEGKHLVDKNCSPINVEQLEKCFDENPISTEHLLNCANETYDTPKTDTTEQQSSDFAKRRLSDAGSVESKSSSDSLKHMPIIESFAEVNTEEEPLTCAANSKIANIPSEKEKQNIDEVPLNEVKQEVGTAASKANLMETQAVNDDALKSPEDIKEESKDDSITDITASKSSTQEETKNSEDNSTNLITDIKNEDFDENKANVRKEIEALENPPSINNVNTKLQIEVQKIQTEHTKKSFSVNDIMNNIGNKVTRNESEFDRNKVEMCRHFIAHEIGYCSVDLYFINQYKKTVKKTCEEHNVESNYEQQQMENVDENLEESSTSENFSDIIISEVQNSNKHSEQNKIEGKSESSTEDSDIICTNKEKQNAGSSKADLLEEHQIKPELEDRATPSEDSPKPSEGVQYRHAIKIEENSVLLHLAGELVEVNFTIVDGKKVFTVVPLSNSTLVDVNDNYDVQKNKEEEEKKPMEPVVIEIDDTEVKTELVEEIQQEERISLQENQPSESDEAVTENTSRSNFEKETTLSLPIVTENVNNITPVNICEPKPLDPLFEDSDLMISRLEEILTKEANDQEPLTNVEIELPIPEAVILESGDTDTLDSELDNLCNSLEAPIPEPKSDSLETPVLDPNILAESPVILPVDETNEVIIADLSHEEEVIIKLDSEIHIPLPEQEIYEEPVSTSVMHLNDKTHIAKDFNVGNRNTEDETKLASLPLKAEERKVEKQVEPATSTACSYSFCPSPKHRSPTIYTKAAKKAYECDLQIPSITTTGDMDTSACNKAPISPNDVNSKAPISPNDVVSSSKTKPYRFIKSDSENTTKQKSSEKLKHKHLKRSVRISEKIKSNNEKKKAFKKLLEKQRQRREAKLSNTNEDHEEFVDFKELLKARKLKKLKKMQQLNNKEKEIKSINVILSENSKPKNNPKQSLTNKTKSDSQEGSSSKAKTENDQFEEKTVVRKIQDQKSPSLRNTKNEIQDQKSPFLASCKNELKELKIPMVKIDALKGKTDNEPLESKIFTETTVKGNDLVDKDLPEEGKHIKSNENIGESKSINLDVVKNIPNKGIHKHEENKSEHKEREDRESALDTEIVQTVVEEGTSSPDVSNSKKTEVTPDKEKMQKYVDETKSIEETSKPCLMREEIRMEKHKEEIPPKHSSETFSLIKKPVVVSAKVIIEHCNSKISPNNIDSKLQANSAIQTNKNTSTSQKSPLSNHIMTQKNDFRLDHKIPPKNLRLSNVSASITRLERKEDMRSNIIYNKNNLLRDPRRRPSGQIMVPSVSELIEENEIVFPKRKLSLEEYNKRKRKLSDDSKPREFTAKTQEKVSEVSICENKNPQTSTNCSNASKPDSTTKTSNLDTKQEAHVQPCPLVESSPKPENSHGDDKKDSSNHVSPSSNRLVDPRLRLDRCIKRRATCATNIDTESHTSTKLFCEEKQQHLISDSSSKNTLKTASKISSRRKSLEQSKAVLQCSIPQKPRPLERKHRTMSLDTIPEGLSQPDPNLTRQLSCDESKNTRKKVNFDDWEETQSPKLFHQKSKEPECLNEVFSGLLKKSKPLIDISDFKLNPIVAKDETLLAYKEKVDSKLNSLQIQIPKVAKSSPPKSTNDLMQRFLHNEKMTEAEMEKIKDIISFKRKVQQLKSVKSPDSSLSPLNPTYEVRKQSNEADTIKLHIKKISGKRKSEMVVAVEESFSEDCDSDFTDVSDRPNRGDYSVVQYNSLEKGVPKIIIKRKSEPEVTQPVVVLERIDLDTVLDKKQKLC